MSELDGKPYVCAWESNSRDYRGSRIVKFRVCYTLRITKRLSKPFLTREQAEKHAQQVDGFGNRIPTATLKEVAI
jgi:hypothetical protein